MGVKRLPSPTAYDADYLYEWPQHGLTFSKLLGMDPPGRTKQQEYLLSNVPHVTSMLRSGFNVDELSSLQPEIPLPMYATAWEHGIHSKVLNKAYFSGSVTPDSATTKKVRQSHRIFPTINEGSVYNEKNVIPGNLGHFVSSLISGATPEEALEAHRTLLPYARTKSYYPDDRDEPEERSHVPLDQYAKFRKNGGTHEEFKQLFSAVRESHRKKNIEPSTPIARRSLENILSNYSDYRGMGLNHQEAGKAVSKFSEGTSPVMVSGDSTFRKAIKNGATSDEFWDASSKKMDMNKYAEDRKTKNHAQALKKGVFDLGSLF